MLSLVTQGRKPRRLSPEKERMAHGISVFDTEKAAWTTVANASRVLGHMVAELDIPEAGSIQYERTGRYGHYNLLGRSGYHLGYRTTHHPRRPFRGAELMYEIWDLISGNLIEDFGDEAAALTWVKETIDSDGAAYVREIALLEPRPDGRHLIAGGEELVRRASEVPIPRE